MSRPRPLPDRILHHCAWRNMRDTAEFLVERGIDLSIRDHRYDSTAEGWARFRGSDEMADYLAEAAKRRE